MKPQTLLLAAIVAVWSSKALAESSDPIPPGPQVEFSLDTFGASAVSGGYDFGQWALLMSLSFGSLIQRGEVTASAGVGASASDYSNTGLTVSPTLRYYFTRLSPGRFSPFAQVNLSLDLNDFSSNESGTETSTLSPTVGGGVSAGVEYLIDRHFGVCVSGAASVDYDRPSNASQSPGEFIVTSQVNVSLDATFALQLHF